MPRGLRAVKDVVRTGLDRKPMNGCWGGSSLNRVMSFKSLACSCEHFTNGTFE